MLTLTIVKQLWIKREWLLWPTLAGLGLILALHGHGQAPVVSHPLPNTTMVTLPGAITTKIITQTITDPAAAKLSNDLMTQNKSLKVQVGTLTSTIASLKSSGGVGVNGGAITPEGNPSVSGDIHEPNSTQSVESVRSFGFKDFQLGANYSSDGKVFTYNLDQSFVITATTGKRVDGSKLSIVALDQKGVNGSLIPIPTETVEIQAPDNPVKWFVSPRIQGGFSFGQDGRWGVGAFQWLKRGSTLAAEDTTFALFEPALTIRAGEAKLSLIPINVNIGRLPKQPFTNLWVGPIIDLNKQIGVVFSATF